MASLHTHPEATRHATVAPRVTEDDLLRMHAEGRRVELGRGGLVEVTPAAGEHSEIAVRLLVRLDGYVEAKRPGRVYGPDAGFRLSEQPLMVRAPDVVFVAGGRIPATADRRRFVPVAPDLAVEIISPRIAPPASSRRFKSTSGRLPAGLGALPRHTQRPSTPAPRGRPGAGGGGPP